MQSKPYIIGVAGPSCSGKTLLSSRLTERLKGATILPVDSYYHDLSRLTPEQRALNNFDAPDAIEHELFNSHMRLLAAGEPVDRPVYDFATHMRMRQTIQVAPGAFLIVEGLFALYWPESRELMRMKIFINAPGSVCLDRRQCRDMRERGRTAQSVLDQYEKTVAPMFETYCLPTRAYADIILDGQGNIDEMVETVAKRIAAGC